MMMMMMMMAMMMNDDNNDDYSGAANSSPSLFFRFDRIYNMLECHRPPDSNELPQPLLLPPLQDEQERISNLVKHKEHHLDEP